MSVVERKFSVNGYQLAAREWHSDAPIKVIACHGWLDNSASFDVLAPLLPQCHIIALDMPGHGLSDHKALHANYNIWEDTADIVAVADVMGWDKFHLLSHSRGAIISLLLTAAMPQRVDSLLMLDALLPLPVDESSAAAQLGKHLLEVRRARDKQLPCYDTVQKALAARCKAAKITEFSALPIVERGLKKTDEGYRWRSDARLTTASSFKLTAGHNQSFVDAISVPHSLLMAEEGIGGNEKFIAMVEQYPTLNTQFVAGTHHLHMDQAREVATIVSDFYQQLSS